MSILRERHFTIDEAAELVGVHRVTIDRWCRYGLEGRKLRRFKKGGRLVILERDLEDFIESTSNMLGEEPEKETDDIAERARRADAACERLGA